MATITAASGGGNWTTGTTWVGNVAPTAADDAVLDNTSGNVTINSGAVARSLDCTGYTGTLTHTAGVTLTLGDGTAGAGNIALKLVNTMTAYSLGNATTSAISFVSTSATQQTITWGGRTPGNVTFNGAGGSWQVQDTWTASSTTVTLTAGTFDTNGKTCSWSIFSSNNSNVRTLTLSSSSIACAGAGATIVWDINNSTNFAITANTATVTMAGSGAIFQTAAINYNGMSVVFTGSGNGVIGAGAATFLNVTRSGTAVKTDGFQLNGNSNTLTVTGTLTLNGNSTTNRLLVKTGTAGIQATINAANTSISNADFQDIVGAGAGNWNLAAITGNSGDCGNNSGINFTTPASQTWSGTSGGNWSANAWTSRIPLPQDDVAISSAFSASQTVTADMPRMGKSISWLGTTGSPTWSFGSTANAMYGSLTLISGMTISGAQITTLQGRSTHTITSAGQTFTQALIINGPSGTYTMQDALVTNSTLTINGGTLATSNFTLTASTITASGTTAILAVGSSTVNFTSTAATIVFNRGASATITATGANFVVSTASANARTMSVGGNGPTLATSTITYTVASSTGALILAGSALVIDTITITGSHTLTITSGITYTVNNFNVSGTAGNLVTLNATTPGSAGILSKTSGMVSSDYLSIQDSTVTGGASWYAGNNSTNVSGNTGWIFTGPSNGWFFIR